MAAKPQDVEAEATSATVPPPTAAAIGSKDAILRVLNFSRGGFDTTMQVGVIHALLVMHGRAPDIVIGVSAGAIQAAALAEVMRAAETPANAASLEELREKSRRASSARVARLREFMDACQKAPEDLLDSLLPDAYQIDSFDPLSPLDQPTQHPQERREREESGRRKAGFSRLYNDLLSLDIPVGVATRLVRRYLGLSAVGNVGKPGFLGTLQRILVGWTEVLKLWLLIGQNLGASAQVARLFIRPLLVQEVATGPLTAESIMFRAGFFTQLWRRAWAALWFVVTLSCWVGVTCFVPWLLGGAISLVLSASGVGEDWRDTVMLSALAALLVLPLFPVLLWGERKRFVAAVKDLGRGILMFVYSFVKWAVVLLVLATTFSFVLTSVVMPLIPGDYPLSSVGLVAGIALVVMALLSVFLLVRRFREWSPRALPHLLGVHSAFAVVVSLFIVPAVFLLAAVSNITAFIEDPSFATVVDNFALGAALILPAAALISVSFVARRHRDKKFGAWMVLRFLERYNLGKSLAHEYPLKKLLVELFDRDHYGRIASTAAAEAVLGDKSARDLADEAVVSDRPVARYAETSDDRPPIRVGLAVANLQTGRLETVGQEENIVNGLLAATAIPPLLPPRQLGKQWYVDASNVGNIPTRALMGMLRDYAHPDIAAVHVYAVDPLPVSAEKLPPPVDIEGKEKQSPYLNLIDTAMRALKLERFRDAQVERKLTYVFTNALPKTGPGTFQTAKKRFFRAFVAPIELDKPVDLTRRILFAKKEERRDALATTFATGCRAALQVMLAKTLEEFALSGRETISCDAAVDRYKKRTGCPMSLPGSASDAPGLAEVCKHCSIKDKDGEVIARRSLKLPKHAEKTADFWHLELAPHIVDWPQEIDWQHPGAPPIRIEKARAATPPSHQDAPKPVGAPPLKICLFGGGVFRGVFQMGVLNALSLVRFKPDLVAGASIGSITAAMATSVLTARRAKREARIEQMTKMYLAMDRLVLTDRFADFIRTWTIRAAQARFSIRDADTVFRKYDFRQAGSFQRTFRAVVAGLERLFYINPYQLNEIVMAARNRQLHELTDLLKARAQQWLDRMNVGAEILGAEPLWKLIEPFVLRSEYEAEPRKMPLSRLAPKTQLLATTTNLTQGELQILGSIEDKQGAALTLMETLLASSAFPGVFRPRRSWDLRPGDSSDDQYVDGGIVDNLPLEPVLQELRARARERKADVRPAMGPHLMIAASLEPASETIGEEEARSMAGYWPDVQRRQRELKYNVKLDMYESSLRETTLVYEALTQAAGANESQKPPRPPLYVELVGIKPKWLCDTFAFHPMLGFRRIKQARSIAHGCASTLLALAKVRSGARKRWRLIEAAIPDGNTTMPDPKERADERAAGKCWLVDRRCPFAKDSLSTSLGKESRYWINQVYVRCWERKTHERPMPKAAPAPTPSK